MVCYQLQNEVPPWMNGKRVAIRVSEKREACICYSEEIKVAQ